ncbi:MAG TPA: hypothetical protein VGD17_16480 [Chitinophagaceae bacterium]
MSNKRIYLSLSLILLLSLGFIAFGNIQPIKEFFGNRTDKVDSPGKKDPVQEALIREFQELLGQFDTTHKNYSMTATFSALDKTDPEHALNDIPYAFHRHDNDFYFRFGGTETLNTGSASVYVDHNAKTIVVGQPKRVVQPGMLPFNELYEVLRSEEYVLAKSERTENGLSVLTMKNETHLSCKEMQLHYEPVNRTVKIITVRIPDISDHLDETKEKNIILHIRSYRKIDDKPLPASLDKFVQNVNGEWKQGTEFKNYELILE